MALPGDVKPKAESSYRSVDAPQPEFVEQQLPLEGRRQRGPIFEILAIGRRNWQLVALVWFLVLAGSAAHGLFSVPRYTASGAVQVSARDGLGAGNPLIEMASGGGGRMELHTEVELMRRQDFLLGALYQLNLQIVDPKEPSSHTTDLDITLRGKSPINPLLRQIRQATEEARIPATHFTSVTLRLTGAATNLVDVDILKSGKTSDSHTVVVGELLETSDIRLKFAQMPLPVGESLTVRVLPDGYLFGTYRSSLTVSALGTAREPTNMVQLQITSSDREVASSLVQLMMDRYLEQSLAWQAQRASRSAEFIREQLVELGQQLTARENDLREFAEQRQAVDLATQARVTIETGAQVRAERSAVDLEERVVGEVNQRLKGKIKRGASSNLSANFLSDPLLGEAIKNLSKHEIELELLRTTLNHEHPQVKVLESQLERERKEISKLLDTVRRNLEARRRLLDERSGELKQSLAQFPEKQLEFSRLNRSVEISQGVYGLLLEKLQESEIMEAATTTDKRIVDSARPPHTRSAPRRSKILALGLLGGLLAGFGAAFLYSTMHQRLATVEAVREQVDYPVYATIPKIDAPEEALNQGRLAVDWIWRSPHDPAPEAFRTLRVNVGFVPAVAGRGRVLQITSSEPAEGKSTVLSNLAVSLVKSGSRVLVIDLDLRRPVQHRIWQQSRSPGYSELSALAGDADETEFIHQIPEHGIDFIPAGKKVPETLSSIMSPALPRLLRKLAERYDYVLIDSPPVFVSDALVVAPYVDLLMVTARPGSLHRSKLSHAADLLSRVTNTPKGLVLNGVSREHSDYYSSGYYYYSGSYYGSNDDDGDTIERSSTASTAPPNKVVKGKGKLQPRA